MIKPRTDQRATKTAPRNYSTTPILRLFTQKAVPCNLLPHCRFATLLACFLVYGVSSLTTKSQPWRLLLFPFNCRTLGNSSLATFENRSDSMAAGFVYVLPNESYRGLVKIGKSRRHPNLRAKELSGTGVLHPYLVAYYERVSDCDLAERLVHEELKQFRRSVNREFFKVSSTKAIRIVQLIVNKVNSEHPVPVPTQTKPAQSQASTPPPRLYAVSFNCNGCGSYQSS